MPTLLNSRFPEGWYFLNRNNTVLERSSKIFFSVSERRRSAIVGQLDLHNFTGMVTFKCGSYILGWKMDVLIYHRPLLRFPSRLLFRTICVFLGSINRSRDLISGPTTSPMKIQPPKPLKDIRSNPHPRCIGRPAEELQATLPTFVFQVFMRAFCIVFALLSSAKYCSAQIQLK